MTKKELFHLVSIEHTLDIKIKAEHICFKQCIIDHIKYSIVTIC